MSKKHCILRGKLNLTFSNKNSECELQSARDTEENLSNYCQLATVLETKKKKPNKNKKRNPLENKYW